MLPNPLHPALVHFPIVLAVLLPLVAVAALVAIRRGVQPRKAWAAVVAFGGVMWLSAFVTAKVGEADEERVEEVVAEAALETHEEAGELFGVLAGVAAVLLATGLLGGTAGRTARLVGTGATAVLVLAVYNVGRTGGELVYTHGAARAYSDGPTVGVVETRATVADRRHRDDDDEDEH